MGNIFVQSDSPKIGSAVFFLQLLFYPKTSKNYFRSIDLQNQYKICVRVV